MNFQDGHEVDATAGVIEPIELGCGHDEYDVILVAPFPNITVSRWSPQGVEHSSAIVEDAQPSHWFSRDNRRLYCLQRAAMKHWPRRVGAFVDVQESAPKDIWKYTTTSFGTAVGVKASNRVSTIRAWNWRAEVVRSSTQRHPKITAALDYVAQDEQRHFSALASPPLDLRIADIPPTGAKLERLVSQQDAFNMIQGSWSIDENKRVHVHICNGRVAACLSVTVVLEAKVVESKSRVSYDAKRSLVWYQGMFAKAVLKTDTMAVVEWFESKYTGSDVSKRRPKSKWSRRLDSPSPVRCPRPRSRSRSPRR